MEGRFIQKDPIGFRGGINLYAYVKNNSVNRKDPKGLQDIGGDDSSQYDFSNPDFGFVYHGNWCGPGWTGGLAGPYNPGQSYLSPVDPLDNCCKDHDTCYADCRAKWPCDSKKRGECMTSCDRTLANCAASCGHKKSSPLWWWMQYNKKPDPGPNAQ